MIIGITGHLGSGKTEVAGILIEHGFVRQRFAQPLKDMLRAVGIGADYLDGALKEEPCPLLGGASARHAMQTLGTEWGRNLIHPDLWILIWRARVKECSLVVVDDVRFPNEAEAILSLGGAIWRVSRPGCDGNGHISESYVDRLSVSQEILNNGTTDWLRRQVDVIVREFVWKGTDEQVGS